MPGGGLGWQCADALAATGAVRTVRVASAHAADRDIGIVIIGGGVIGLLCALVLRVYDHSHIRIAEPTRYAVIFLMRSMAVKPLIRLLRRHRMHRLTS